MNFISLCSLATFRTPANPWDTRSPAQCRVRVEWEVFSLIRSLPSPLSADGLVSWFEWFIGVGSEEVHKVALVLTSVRRSHCTCRFPACSVHEDAVFRDAKEGIKSIRLTSPYSR